MSDDFIGPPNIGELSRQVQSVLVRIENVATKLESQYVRNDLWLLWSSSIESRVSQLEDNNKWLVRLVIGLVVGAIVAGVLVAGGGK